MKSTFRSATHQDRDQILDIHRKAFGDDGETIAGLVAEMLDDPTAEPFDSFVAEQANEIVAHVLFTAVQIEPGEVPAKILAPLAVLPNHQGCGISSKLVNESLAQLQANGVALVFVLGYPNYYSRFGFSPAGIQGFEAPYPILPKNAEAWMVKELQPSAIESNQGMVRCCNALDQPQYWRE